MNNANGVELEEPNVPDVETEKVDEDSKGNCSEVQQDPKGNDEDDWDTSPHNPRNWSSTRKWTAVGVVSLYTFIAPLASSMIAPGLPEIGTQYHITSSTELNLVLSIFLLSFAFAPLILAPLSEMYGRTWVLHIGNLLSIGINLGCAFVKTKQSLIALRFLAGAAGAAPAACGGGSIADLFDEKGRASAMALYILGPLLGPIIGPVAGGFITQDVGIKWVFIVIGVVCGVAALIGIPLLQETYGPVIRLRLNKKAQSNVCDIETNPTQKGDGGKRPTILYATGKQRAKYVLNNLTRPILILAKSFICFILSLYLAFNNGIYYLMFVTFAELFATTYGFGPGVGGLAYLGLGVGFISATIVGVRFADRVYAHLARKNGGKGKPEMRIPAMFLGSLFVPIGIFWYGWSAQAKLHWIMPIIGTGIFGFGLMNSFLSVNLYLVDAFTFAASALAAGSVFRSMVGFIFPLFGEDIYKRLGLGGGNSLLAGLAIVLGIPFPVWIYFKGEEMRQKNQLTKS
ncbi:multidrug resistance protein 4 [Pluteus cervinus]|uniref:Multidrug resistance protein 4 n=1 Tax=Pluteus cervinus TaxID=181527 RepID=A0ACD3B3A8_9AGAR|nr:multidrug resistance protein 4 [Pluteus cervinus]